MNRRNPLTDVELDVLEKVAQGLENHQIATATFRSVETVRSHLKNIFRKLRARNRTHAVAIAYHVGIFRGRSADVLARVTHARSPLQPGHSTDPVHQSCDTTSPRQANLSGPSIVPRPAQ